MYRKGNQILGLSSDSKPTTGTRVGVEFLETNTGATFVWSGTTWLPTWAHIGATGAQGPTGKTGATGPTGVTGPTGA